MSFNSKEAYRRSIELRISLADSINNFTIENLMYQLKFLPETEFLVRIGFGDGEDGKSAYRDWLKELIMGFSTTVGIQRLLQNLMYTNNMAEEEVFDRATVIEMIRHHLNQLTDSSHSNNIDINLFFDLLLSSTVRIDETTTNMDSPCLDTASRLLLSHPEIFYPRFFQGFSISDTNFYKVMINPNGMESILSHDNTYKHLVEILRNNTEIIPKAIVHFYDNYFAKGISEWNIEYPEGFNTDKYKYKYDLMQALFATVLERA